MNIKKINDSDHVSRYCSPVKVKDGIPLPTAFIPRPNEKFLSVNWLEYFHESDICTCLQRVQEVMCNKGYWIKRNGRFAVFNIGKLKAEFFEVTKSMHIEIRHMPSMNDQSHAGIFTTNDTDLVGDIEIANVYWDMLQRNRLKIHLAEDCR